jgi:hypothetical protein
VLQHITCGPQHRPHDQPQNDLRPCVGRPTSETGRSRSPHRPPVAVRSCAGRPGLRALPHGWTTSMSPQTTTAAMGCCWFQETSPGATGRIRPEPGTAGTRPDRYERALWWVMGTMLTALGTGQTMRWRWRANRTLAHRRPGRTATAASCAGRRQPHRAGVAALVKGASVSVVLPARRGRRLDSGVRGAGFR